MIPAFHAQLIFWMSSLSNDEIKKVLIPANAEKILLICIGNSFRKDDGIGSYIAGKLSNVMSNIVVINAFDKPENIIDEAIGSHAERIIIIDAADFNGKPGEIRIIPNDLIPEKTLSTHTFPVKIIARMLEHESGAEVFFLGIQIKEIGFGEGISREVKEAGDNIIEIIKRVDFINNT